jgi:hypothetical protein
MRMGLSKDEFFSLTPRLFRELRKQYLGHERESYTMLALLRLDVINFSYRAPKDRITLDDLLPPEIEPAEPVKRARMTAKRRAMIADGIRRLFANCVIEERGEHGRLSDGAQGLERDR